MEVDDTLHGFEGCFVFVTEPPSSCPRPVSHAASVARTGVARSGPGGALSQTSSPPAVVAGMLDSAPHILVIVEDRHAERELKIALATLAARGRPVTVLSGDALLVMWLRLERVDARLTIDGLSRDLLNARDQLALGAAESAFSGPAPDDAGAAGADLGPYIQYTLIPTFVRAVRNLFALEDLLNASSIDLFVLVGGGPLVDAARLIAQRRAIPTELVGGSLMQRSVQAFARLRAGRATRWVNTTVRAIVLEPGFIALMFLKGGWKRLTGAAPASGADALVVAGDRFTADVVERLRGENRPVVLAGATQPGRALFASVPDLQPIEAFTEWGDVLRTIAGLFRAAAATISLANDDGHARRVVAAGVPYWRLVRGTVCLHVLVWTPLLRHLQALAGRAARRHPDAQLLVSHDVTAYNRVLIDTVRQHGIRSLGIQHGIVGEPNGHSVVHVDTLAAWGEATERRYRALAPQTSRFVVTGNPLFDRLAARSVRTTRLDPGAAHGKTRGVFTIVICTGFV